MPKQLTVKKIDPLSLGKTTGLLYALVGLILGAFISLLSIGTSMGGYGMMYGMFFGAGAIILIPLAYGILGYLGGILIAFLYNLVAKYTGGVKLQVR